MSPSPTPSQKDVIYVDIDDEITSLIDKVKSSNEKIVALVLPKRATVLQSVVNMKLLKRTADSTKKRIVLITSEAALLPLAGAVGMYVAKTLQSKPIIPAAPSLASSIPDSIEETAEDEPLDTSQPIAVYAGDDEEEPIEVDDDEPVEEDAALGAAATEGKFNKKLKVPNFERFRLLAILGGLGLIALIVGFVVANHVLPKARIVLKTDTTTLNPDLSFTSGIGIKTLDEAKMLVPATNKELKKSDIEKVTATGQRDDGTKATGTVKIYNCNKDDKLGDTIRTVPAGTGVSYGNTTFILNADVAVAPSGFTGDTCKYDKPSAATAVTAQSAGDRYNLGAKTNHEYGVAGYSSMRADGSDMTGGTSKITKVISQADVDGAKQKLLDRTATTATDDLKRQLDKDGLVLLPDTLSAGTPTVSSAPDVNQEGTEAVVTLTTTYTAQAVKKDDLQKLIENDAKKNIDTSKQSILDNGINKAELRITEKKANNTVQVELKATVVAGPQLDAEAIKRDVAGKKKGEALQILNARPGIKEANVSLSPFWVSKAPKNVTKITVVFEQNDSSGK